jgi:hypothetical protein
VARPYRTNAHSERLAAEFTQEQTEAVRDALRAIRECLEQRGTAMDTEMVDAG